MDSEDNYNKITAAISAAEKYENMIHEVCHVPRVASLKEFYQMYEIGEKAIDDKYDGQPKVAPTIELFAEAFKKLDEFPTNLQKPKKIPPMRERLNSNISKSSPTLNESAGLNTTNQNKVNSSSLSNLHKLDVPTTSETLSDYVKFQKQLKVLKAEISQQDIEKEYANKLKQLKVFAQQLEKLLPTEKVGKSALSLEEETILGDLVNRMDDLNFIRMHHNVFRKQNGLINNNSAKMEGLIDILSYCLEAVNSSNLY